MEEYKASPVGHEISSVMHGISHELLNSAQKLKEILLTSLKLDNFTILDVISKEFEPKGYSICVLLSESHASIHTYPEYNSLAFQLYTCRSAEDGEQTYKNLLKELKPTKIDEHKSKIIVDPKFKMPVPLL